MMNPPSSNVVDASRSSAISSRSVEEIYRQAAVLAGQERFHEANCLFNRAADLRSDKELWRFKSLGFCPTVFPDVNSIDLYWNKLNRSLDLAIERFYLETDQRPTEASDFNGAEAPTARRGSRLDWQTLPTDGFCPSFNLPHLGKCCKEIREKFCKLFAKSFDKESRPTEGGISNAKRTARQGSRLRIGFHALHGHEGGFTRGTAGLVEGLDKKRFEIYVFAPDLGIEQCKQSIKSDDVTYVSLGGTFETVVKKVRETECDLIYYRKAGSDPWSYFFPFARCAPVQVTSYGTHGTSGISAIDYFLSSSWVEPENGQDYYTEKLFNLDAMPTYQRRLAKPDSPATREEFHLPKTGAIYFCPHRTAKYHPGFDPILNEILQRDPAGHVVMLIGRDPRGRERLQNRLKRNLGDDVIRRTTLIPALPFDKYKRLLSLATCMLDSPVYAGGLTSFDAFSYGVPEVTISGPLHVQNFATGIYRRMGLGKLPCSTANDYVDLAVRLGTEPEYRKSISDEIDENSNKIFGSSEVIEEHEKFFESVCA